MILVLVFLAASALSLLAVEIAYVELSRTNLQPFWAAVPTVVIAFSVVVASTLGLFHGGSRERWYWRAVVLSLVVPFVAVISWPLWIRCGADTYGMFFFMAVLPLAFLVALIGVGGCLSSLLPQWRENTDDSPRS